MRIYNRTLEYAYLSGEFMDFATFSKIAILMKLYINNDIQTMGFLSYKDLLYAGKYIQTYSLLQNNTEFMIKNDIVFRNLEKGIKMQNLAWTDKNMIIQMNFDMGDLSNRIGLDRLYLIYRHIEMTYRNTITFPYAMNYTQFTNLLATDTLLIKLKTMIDKSLASFKKQDTTNQVVNYTDIIARIIDLNNNTYIETYELLIAQKVVSLYNELADNDILTKKNRSEIEYRLLKFNDKHIFTLDDGDIDYLDYVI
jgi:hypothetical protein